MHYSTLLALFPFFIALTTTTPTPMDHSTLQKRHFWCNGADSETICPPGDTMVPIDSYACDQIKAAGRLNQISPPTNGETHTDCGPNNTPPASSSAPGGSNNPAPSPSPGPSPSSTRPAGTAGPTDVPKVAGHKKEHLTCTQIGGGSNGGSSMMLNCTIDGAA